MPEVLFHVDLTDRTGYACRLLRKAHRQSVRVRVLGESAALDRLDLALWTFEALEFVPHARLTDKLGGASLRAPIWLQEPGQDWPESLPRPGVVLNLGPQPVPPSARADRIIELVGQDPAERLAGRERWRRYRAEGLNPVAVSGVQAAAGSVTD